MGVKKNPFEAPELNGLEEGYLVADASTNFIVYGNDYALQSLEDVSAWIEEN